MKTRRYGDLKFSFYNTEEFERIYEDIFKKGVYDIKLNSPSPKILDCGAHIGLSVLFFKQKYPNAKITAFEPNPYSFQILEKNVSQNNLKNITLKNQAISDKTGKIDFYISEEDIEVAWSWDNAAVKNKWLDLNRVDIISVNSTTLKPFLKEKIDLLKLDIEGMEERALTASGKNLSNARNITLEFHGSTTNPGNNVHRVIHLLKKQGYEVKVNQGWKFIPEDKINERKDPFWLSIYASN